MAHKNKKEWVVLPFFLVGLALTTLACSSETGTTSRPYDTSRTAASETPGASAPGPPFAATSRETIGEVVSTNPTEKLLVVRAGTGEMTFTASGISVGTPNML